MNNTTCQTIDLTGMTREDMRNLNLSFYTLSRWAAATHYTDPRNAVNSGVLKLDELGNFLSYTPEAR